MKKFFAAAIAVLMTASLAACGSTPLLPRRKTPPPLPRQHPQNPHPLMQARATPTGSAWHRSWNILR